MLAISRWYHDLYSFQNKESQQRTEQILEVEPNNLLTWSNETNLVCSSTKTKLMVKGLYPHNFFKNKQTNKQTNKNKTTTTTKNIKFGFSMFFGTLKYGESPYVIYFCCLKLFSFQNWQSRRIFLSNGHRNEFYLF